MNLPELTSLITSGEIDKLKSTLEISRYAYFISDAFNSAIGTVIGSPGNNALHIKDFKQYNPKQHDVFDVNKRKDKVIGGSEDSTDPNGAITTRTIPVDIVKVTRLGIPEQKKIVLLAAAFLGTPELNATPNPGVETDMFSVFKTIYDDNKLEYKFKGIAKRVMSERECAELWYTQPAEPDFWEGTPMQSEFKLRMRILSPALGDTLYPVYDEYGDMIAFGRYYETVTEIANTLVVNDRIAHLDIYTADRFYYLTKQGGGWELNFESDMEGTPTTTVGIPNPLGKIPVIYYAQPITEWQDIQEMIDRLEVLCSNHADTNDYSGAPIVVADGEVEGFASKGETGKLITTKNGGKVSYLTYDHAPESVKMEVDRLLLFIKVYTHTPDITFENIKGMGSFSGIALKMFFMDAHLKASDKEELFGQGLQRRANYLKAAIATLNPKFKGGLRVVIKHVFKYFLPRNEAEEITNINTAYQGGFLSLESAVRLNPLVTDPEAELLLIKAEKAQAQADALKIAQQTKPLPITGEPIGSN